jgi:hypothetical protein
MIFKTGLCKTRRTKILERSYHQKNGGGWRRVSAASNDNGVPHTQQNTLWWGVDEIRRRIYVFDDILTP